MTGRVVVASRYRKVTLRTPPPAGSQGQVLAVPDGASAADVLRWAAECLHPDALAELRAILGPELEPEPAR